MDGMSLSRLLRSVPSEPSLPHAFREASTVVASLTGLRWIAASVVFVYHLRNVGYFDGARQQFLTAVFGGGSAAVSLFFVLSGFVLALSHRATANVFATWGRRLVRIWPLHLVGVIAAGVLGLTLYPPIRTADPAAALANLFLVSSWRSDWWQAGNPVSWSLTCEAFFYLTFPLLFRLLTLARRTALWAVAAVAVTLVWVMPALINSLPGSLSAYSFPPARLPEFVVGVVLALLMRLHGFRGVRLRYAVVVAAAGCIAAATAPTDPRSYAAFTVVGFGLLLTALTRRAREGKSTVLGHPVLVSLGRVSFAFYLVHLLCLQAVYAVAGSSLQACGTSAALLAFTLALILAFVLHLTIERPFVRAFAPLWP
jgi:peptidoglycan/LPS O-acetylase OafA/YrhL